MTYTVLHIMSGFGGEAITLKNFQKVPMEFTLPASVFDPKQDCYIEMGVCWVQDTIHFLEVPKNPFKEEQIKVLLQEKITDPTVQSIGLCGPSKPKGLRLFSNAQGGELFFPPGRTPVDEIKRFMRTTDFCHQSYAELVINGEVRCVDIFRKVNAMCFENPEMIVITEEMIDDKKQCVVSLKE